MSFNVIALESAWLDPLVEFYATSDAVPDSLVRVSPSMALLLLNLSGGRVPLPVPHLNWILHRKAGELKTNIQRVGTPWFLSANRATSFILSHRLVKDSLVEIVGTEPISVQSAAHLHTLGALTGLRRLSLNLVDVQSLAALSPLSQLTSLSFRGHVTDHQLAPLRDTLTQLKRLVITPTARRDQGAQFVPGPPDDIDQADVSEGDDAADPGFEDFGPDGANPELEDEDEDEPILPQEVQEGLTGTVLDLIPTLIKTLTHLEAPSLGQSTLARCHHLHELFIEEPSTMWSLPSLSHATSITARGDFLKALALTVGILPVRSLSVEEKLTTSSISALSLLAALTEIHFNRPKNADHEQTPPNFQDFSHLSALKALRRVTLNDCTTAVPSPLSFLAHSVAPLRDLTCTGRGCLELLCCPTRVAFKATLTRLHYAPEPSERQRRILLLPHMTALRNLSLLNVPAAMLGDIKAKRLASLSITVRAEPVSQGQLQALARNMHRLSKLRLDIMLSPDAYQDLGAVIASCPYLQDVELAVQVRERDFKLSGPEFHEFFLKELRVMPLITALMGLEDLISFKAQAEVCWSLSGKDRLWQVSLANRENILAFRAGPGL